MLLDEQNRRLRWLCDLRGFASLTFLRPTPSLGFLGNTILLCIFYIKEDLCEGCLTTGDSAMALRAAGTHKRSQTSPDTDGRRRSQSGPVVLARDRRLSYLQGELPFNCTLKPVG